MKRETLDTTGTCWWREEVEVVVEVVEVEVVVVVVAVASVQPSVCPSLLGQSRNFVKSNLTG